MDKANIDKMNAEARRMEQFQKIHTLDMDKLDDLTVNEPHISDNLDSIRVCVRIRPPSGDDVSAWGWDRQTVQMIKASRRNSMRPGAEQAEQNFDIALPTYNFDYLFHPEDDNAQIYSDLGKSIVAKSLEGYHGCIFTYGQTASGKTFTMNGTAKSPGLVPHATFDCFEMMENMKDRVFTVRLAYLELYREQVLDLLNPDVSASEHIKIQYDPKIGTVITGLSEELVENPQQIMLLLQRGESLRHVGATDMNEKSSRAHTIFRLMIESRSRDPSDLVIRKSTLNLIDLAGSENARMTGSTGDRAKEAKFINQSLLTLSTIIQRLGDVRSGGHLPFRDSKLTRILQDPLSGNAVIAIICTISTSLRCSDETNNTLKFAARAKKITLATATINEHMDDKALLKHYESEITSLKDMVNDLMGRLQSGAGNVSGTGSGAGGGDSAALGPYIKTSIMKLVQSMEQYMEKSRAKQGEENVSEELKQHEREVETMLKEVKEKIDVALASGGAGGDASSPQRRGSVAVAEDMTQLELKLRVADNKYLLEELKKKERHVDRVNMELYDQERIIRRMAATILKLGGNPEDLVQIEEDDNASYRSGGI